MGQWFRDKKVYADLGGVAGPALQVLGAGTYMQYLFNNFHMVCFMRGEGFEDC